MDSFRRQKIDELILINIKFIKGEVLDIGGTNNTKEILNSILLNFQASSAKHFLVYKRLKF